MSDSPKNNINEKIKVEIAENKMKVFLTINEPDSEESPLITSEVINEIIDKAGVKFGLKPNIIQEIIDSKRWGEKIEIAEGVYPTKGEDADLEFYFQSDKSLRPQITEDGHVDYKEVHTVDSVEKGDLLVRIIAATQGTPGMDATGKEISAKFGKDINIIAGPGTFIDQDDKLLIKASIEGVVFYNHKTNNIEVQQLFVVQNSVDYSTGNIHVKSSIEIKGDIKPGFSVTTPYNIQVKGVIEYASVLCGGSLKVKGGINGDGEQKLKVGGDIHTGYLSNYHVKCGGSVIVSTEIRNAYIECDDEIIVTKNTGIIIGGKVTATNKVTSPIIGNSFNIPTEIEVGVNLIFKEQFMIKAAEIISLQKQMEELKKKISLAAEIENNNVKIARLKILKDQWLQCTAQIEKVRKDSEELEKDYYNVNNPTITVIKTVYPGVLIKIKHSTFEVKEEISHVVFKFENDNIIPTSIK
jgi:uncharacterized protein